MRNVYAIFISLMLSVSAFAHTPESAEDFGQPFLKEFAVYPNPTSGALTLTLEVLESTKPLQLKVYSLIGQEMHSEVITPFSGVKKMQLDMTRFPKGIYMLEISNGDKSRIKRVSVI